MPIKKYANKSSQSMKDLIKINETKECVERGCTKFRKGLNRECSAHSSARMYYGDAQAHKIRASYFRAERFKAEHIIDNNMDNELIQRGLSYMQNWLDQVRIGTPGVLASGAVGLMVDEGVTGKELFREALAITIYNDRNPGIIPDRKPEAFQIALCIAVLCYRNLPKLGIRHRSHLHLSISLRKTVGQVLWHDLGRILIEVTSAVSDYEKSHDPATGAAKSLIIHS